MRNLVLCIYETLKKVNHVKEQYFKSLDNRRTYFEELLENNGIEKN